MAGHPSTLYAVRRCITLLRLLLDRGETTREAAEKALKEEYPQRTFERDIATLREAGVKIQRGVAIYGAGTIVFGGFVGRRKK